MASQTGAERYTYPELYLSRWNVYIPTAREGNTLYFPVVWFCNFLKIDKRSQLAVLRSDSRYAKEEALPEVPFNYSGVWRTYLAIRRRECALWISGIDPQRCAPDMRGHIAEFQAELMSEAERLLFGAAPGVALEGRGQVEYSQRERIRIYCQDCGAPHIIIIENGEATVIRDLEGADRPDRGE